MKVSITKKVFILLAVLCTQIGYTQTPQGFNYQAVVRDGNGTPIANQNVSIRLTLQSATGSVYYSESKTTTTNAQGVLNHIVGNGTLLSGSFTSVPWSSGDVFIKAEIDPTGGSSYTQIGDPAKLQSVPFALFASSTTPIAGTNGQTQYHNGTTWVASSVLINDGTNVGIGTSPTQKLDVNGSTRLRGSLYDYTNSTGTANDLLINNGSGVQWKSIPSSGIASGTGALGQVAIWSGANNIQGTKNLIWGTTSLQILSPTAAGTDDPILEVMNKDGKVVFGVYQGGVRIYVEDSLIAKGAKGGFAVGGLSNQSKGQQEYFRITPDSARIYVKDVPTTKGAKGGFAVGGLSNLSKTTVSRNLMFVASDSTRIYIDEPTLIKGAKGGFAVGGLSNLSKGSTYNLFKVTKDSTRIYIDDSSVKGAKGGFAVGGLSNLSKGGSANFFDVSTNSTTTVFPSQKRVMWYPLKNAFLAGQVIIELPDSVGLNSFTTGYESRAKGNYSQALGFQSIARGQYATAIGYQAVANNNNSFAFGYKAKAANLDSYAFGSGAQATGNGSFAFGSVGIDSTTIAAAGNTTGNTRASGDYAFAFGLGSLASGTGSTAFGANNVSSGNFSTAIGYYATSSGTWYSTSIGGYTQATAPYSVAIGFKSVASAAGATSLGYKSIAGGAYSLAGGYGTKAQSPYSVALGYLTTASSIDAFAAGLSTTASGQASFAVGNGTNAAGNYSIALGYQSSTLAGKQYTIAGGYLSSAGGTSAIALGYQANAIGEYSIGLGRSVSATGQDAIAMGNSTTSSGINSVAFGNQTTASGNYSFAAGYGCTADVRGSVVIGRYNLSEGTTNTDWTLTDPLFVIGNGPSSGGKSNALVVYKNGNMKIKGIINPDADNTYDLGSSASKWRYIYSNNTLQTSDIRLKDKVEAINYGLAEILKLKPISFYWKNSNQATKNLGFVAQEVKPIISEAVVEGDDADKTLSMSYTSIIPVLVKGMQEQQAMIDKQKQQIEELINANKRLLDRIENLENK